MSESSPQLVGYRAHSSLPGLRWPHVLAMVALACAFAISTGCAQHRPATAILDGSAAVAPDTAQSMSISRDVDPALMFARRSNDFQRSPRDQVARPSYGLLPTPPIECWRLGGTTHSRHLRPLGTSYETISGRRSQASAGRASPLRSGVRRDGRAGHHRMGAHRGKGCGHRSHIASDAGRRRGSCRALLRGAGTSGRPRTNVVVYNVGIWRRPGARGGPACDTTEWKSCCSGCFFSRRGVVRLVMLNIILSSHERVASVRDSGAPSPCTFCCNDPRHGDGRSNRGAGA